MLYVLWLLPVALLMACQMNHYFKRGTATGCVCISRLSFSSFLSLNANGRRNLDIKVFVTGLLIQLSEQGQFLRLSKRCLYL